MVRRGRAAGGRRAGARPLEIPARPGLEGEVRVRREGRRGPLHARDDEGRERRVDEALRR